jgi:hypothetical protein
MVSKLAGLPYKPTSWAYKDSYQIAIACFCTAKRFLSRCTRTTAAGRNFDNVTTMSNLNSNLEKTTADNLPIVVLAVDINSQKPIAMIGDKLFSDKKSLQSNQT